MAIRMRPPIITEINNMSQYFGVLSQNPGVFIIKFGAVWCGPCKQVEPLIYEGISRMPDNVQCAVIDIDLCLEVYATLKKKRIISGVPVILAYYKGNMDCIPDDMVVGADRKKIIEFFNRCTIEATSS